MIRNIITFFATKHLFGNLITILVILVGLATLLLVRRDLFPQVDYDVSIIIQNLPGASPDQIEKLLINPMEQALQEVDGIKKIQSNATSGRASVIVTLEPDARDTKKTQDDIRSVIDQIDDFPEEATDPRIIAIESGKIPIITLTISSEKLDDIALRDVVRHLSDEIETVDGVAKAEKANWRDQEIKIIVDESKLSRQNVSLSDLLGVLEIQNVQLPAGDAKTGNGSEIAVKTDAEYKTLQDIENVVIRTNLEGDSILVKDIARIEYGLETAEILSRSNGQRSQNITIIKNTNADAIRVLTRVQEKVESLKDSLLSDTKLGYINDITFILSNRINILSVNLFIGVALVFVVLWLFLPLRIAFVVALGIPFSMLATVVVVYLLGLSINLVSLIGLIVVCGMIVDDVIVVVENIYRRIELGEPLSIAVVEGTIEMVPPVTSSVMTTMAAFSPLMFMSGIMGKFVWEIPVMVILALAFSLFEGFLIAPCHFASIAGPKIPHYLEKKKQGIHWYDSFLTKYRSFVHATLDRKWITISLTATFLGITGFMATRTPLIMFPGEGAFVVFLRQEASAGTTLEKMEKLMLPAEAFVQKIIRKDEIRSFETQVGIHQNDPNDPLTRRAPNFAQVQITLTPENDRERTANEIAAEMRQQIASMNFPEILRTTVEVQRSGPPTGKPISINVYGEDFDTLQKLGKQIQEELAGYAGVSDLQNSEVFGKEEIRVVPDRLLAAQAGLSMRDIALSVRAAFAGVVATYVRSLEEKTDIRVQLAHDANDSTNTLRQLLIGNRFGELVPLHKVASFEKEKSRLIIKHQNNKRVLTITGDVDNKQITSNQAAKRIQPFLEQLRVQNPGYAAEFGGEADDTQESLQSLFRAALVAVVVIYFLLIITFQSLSQPAVVLLAIPFGLTGVIWALMIHGMPLSFLASIGAVALAGVIVNNTIVYMDYLNKLRAEGQNLRDALVDTASARLRPIILTSITTVFGLMPTAYGLGGTDGFIRALTIALGWGLVVGSLLTICVFPAIIQISADLKRVTTRVFSFSRQ